VHNAGHSRVTSELIYLPARQQLAETCYPNRSSQLATSLVKAFCNWLLSGKLLKLVRSQVIINLCTVANVTEEAVAVELPT